MGICHDIYLSKKGSLLPVSLRKTNIEWKSDQEQIQSTPPMPIPKKNLKNSDVINTDNNKTLPILNCTTLKENEASRKGNQIALVPEKELPKSTPSNNNNNNNNNNKESILEFSEKFVENSKSVIILGDSMIKHLNGWEMSQKKNNPDCNIYVKHFAEAKSICMKGYMQAS